MIRRVQENPAQQGPARSPLEAGTAVEAGHLKPDTDAELLVGEICALILGLVHDTRFLRDPRAPERARASWQRLRGSYLP